MQANCIFIFTGKTRQSAFRWVRWRAEMVHWNGTAAWRQITFWERASALKRPEESGSAVREEETMWQNGMTIRWIRPDLYCIPRVVSNASAARGVEIVTGVMRTMLTEEDKYMKEAIRQAKKAGKLDEVPIGCVIVRDGKIIARGYNRRNTEKSTLAHAEIQAIRKASKVVGDWRLEDCTMYITLEPCQMCAGAIVQARIPKVVIGSRNPKAGCAGSILDLLHVPAFNHQVELEEGVLQEECSEMLTSFFRELRKKKKQASEKG